MDSKFVDLKRQFEVLRGDEQAAVIARNSYTTSKSAFWQSFSWQEILKWRLVVILGEPGSGKSEELRAQHRANENSFLFSIERLVNEPIDKILSAKELERFHRWLSSNSDALFLLDAVDESKLRHDADFSVAIERLGNEIGSALNRARFVISSRVSEWRPLSDLNTVTERLLLDVSVYGENARPDLGTTETWSQDDLAIVVVLRPLTFPQIKSFVTSKDPIRVTEFLSALEESSAHALAGRPLDVIHLYSYWQEKRELSSLTDVLDYMVSKLLAEISTKEKLDPLTPERAREGAEYLAAAAIFCKNLKFSITDVGHFSENFHLNPGDVLPESWSSNERRSLMNRALFDSASRGTLSFHHREHVDYLASKWVERLMEHNCGFDELVGILFDETTGVISLRSSLEPIAAWLINSNTEPWRGRLAELILKSAPEIHFKYGDPAALSLNYRKRLLSAISEKYKDRRRLGVRVSIDNLARIADVGLSDDINMLISDGAVAEELKCDLLTVVAGGKLTACIKSVIALYSTPAASNEIKTHCAHAIRLAGSSEDIRQLVHLAIGSETLTNTAIYSIVESSYPNILTVSETLAILARANNVVSYNDELTYQLEQHFSHAMRTTDAALFLRGFLDLARKESLGECRQVTENYYWVIPLIVVALEKILSHANVSEAETVSVLDAIMVIDHALLHGYVETWGGKLSVDNLRALLKHYYVIRRRLFWHLVGSLSMGNSLSHFPIHELQQYNGLVQWHTGDIEWFVTDIEDGKRDLIACHAALLIILRITSGKLLRRLRLIPKMKRTLSNRQHRIIFQNHLFGNFIFPISWRWQRYVRHKLLNKSFWKWRHRSVVSKVQNFRNFLWLLRNCSALRKAEAPRSMIDLIYSIRKDDGGKIGDVSWSKARKKWGFRITSSLSVGCKTWWQKYTPFLPHETIEKNSISGFAIVGLVGLQQLWEEKEIDFKELTTDDVERAARYACNEMNGFPEWFYELAARREDIVERVLHSAIAAEFNYPASLENVREVGAKLAHTRDEFTAAVSVFWRALENKDPSNERVLEDVLMGVHQHASVAKSLLSKLAPTRISSYEVSQLAWILWMGSWMNVDAIPALEYLKTVLNRLSGAACDDVIIRLCSQLSGRYGRVLQFSFPSFSEPKSLATLLPLVHLHVRPGDDINRANGGVYSPDARDNAQDFRERLWEILRTSEDSEGNKVLHDFLQVEALHDQQDRILWIIDERNKKLGDLTAWMPKDITTFSRMFRHEPRSDFELYRLVSQYVANIKNEIEKSENASNRSQVREGDLEKSLQGFLARKLEECSLSWYTTTQESEVDLGQRPDLRIERFELNPLPIEVKLANLEHWSVRKLKKGLEDQLLGQYLRPENIRYGIYVVGTTSATRKWKSESGKLIGFAELVSILKAMADDLVIANSTKVYGLSVIGIDFSDPRSSTL